MATITFCGIEVYNPIYFDSNCKKQHYEISWFCNSNKIMHSTPNQRMECKQCQKSDPVEIIKRKKGGYYIKHLIKENEN